MHKFGLTGISQTVTYASDDPIPSNDYGQDVEIVVQCDTTVEKDQMESTITIRIGDNTFLPSDIKHWQYMIDQARAMTKTF